MSSSSLVEITAKEDLLNAAQRLRKHLPRSIKLLNTLLVTAHSQTSTGRKFYTDSNLNEEEALIILVDPFNEKQNRAEISLYCSTDVNWKMRNHLGNLLDWRLKIIFWGVDELQMDIVRSICKEKGHLDFEAPCWIFSLWPKKSLPSQAKKRDDLVVKHVAQKDAGFIDSFWKFSEDGTEDMIRKLCENGEVVGAFSGEDDELAAWMLQTNYGSLGNLYTRSEFRGRGLAREVVLFLTADAVSRGLEPYVHIEDHNHVSMALFAKLGFTKHTKAYWMGYSSSK